MEAAEKFGRRVRAVRKARKLSIGELAEKADTDVKHLGRVERGEKRPSFELIVGLAQALNVSPATFFEFEAVQGDRNVVQKQLARLLADVELAQLQRVHRMLKVLLEP
jgi:transcriptional regulator with XRE-family HTH domain